MDLPGKSADASGDDRSWFEAVDARVLLCFPELVRELGGDPLALLLAAEIDPDCGSGRPGTISYRQAAQLLENAATTLGCPDFGLRLAARQGGVAVVGALGAGMRKADTWGDALRFASEHSYAHSLASGIWLLPSASGRMVTVGHEILLGSLTNRAQLIEQFLMVGHLMAQELTGGRVRARRILFRHQPISQPGLYRRYFGCEVRFGQHADGTVYHERDLAAVVIDRDVQAFQAARSWLEARFADRQPPLYAQVRGVITHFVRTDACTTASVAAKLGMHVRTMHRRLAAEGTSFQQVKDEVRRDLMLFYLGQTDFSLGRVSEGLGFAEQSVMTRFCRRWFDASPSEVRARSSAARGQAARGGMALPARGEAEMRSRQPEDA